MEKDTDVYEHAHTDEEIGDKEGVADKLDAVHQGRHTRNVAV